MSNFIAIGVDIGGSHITTGIVDLKSRLILKESIIRKQIDSQGPLDEILSVWVEVIKASVAFGNTDSIRLGMAMPGPFDYEEGISLMVGQSKYDSFYGMNIKQLLAERLGISKGDILMMNDASSFLKGEVFGGSARNYDNVIGLTLGTGLGSAKYASSFTYDAELWCHPFKESIVEDYLSTRWFLKRFKEVSGKDVQNVKDLVSYTETYPSAVSVFREFGINLGLFLLEFINMEKPEVVILGGNITKAYNFFIEETRDVLKVNSIEVPLVMATLREDASIIGAASLWADNKEFV